ncbi:MAG: hypothetical protein ACK4PI_13285 [Tepidisphaerales bacterium]
MSGVPAGGAPEGAGAGAATPRVPPLRGLFYVLLVLYVLAVAALLLMAWSDRTSSPAGESAGAAGGPVLRLTVP